MAMVVVELAQGAFEIVQAKTFVPKAKAVMFVFGRVGFAIVPEPETKVHKPVPTVGVFAAIVVVGEEIQSVCEGPAFEALGISFTVMVTLEAEGIQGLS